MRAWNGAMMNVTHGGITWVTRYKPINRYTGKGVKDKPRGILDGR